MSLYTQHTHSYPPRQTSKQNPAKQKMGDVMMGRGSKNIKRHVEPATQRQRFCFKIMKDTHDMLVFFRAEMPSVGNHF